MASQSRHNTSGEACATDYDRARFGQQREVWGSENTRSMTSADMSLTYVQRLRVGHDWVGVDKESVVHEGDGSTTRVTLTHWKDHRLDTDAQRAVSLRNETQELSHRWEKSKGQVMEIERAKGTVYDELCNEKYNNSDLQSECIRLEEAIKTERVRTKRIEDYYKKVTKEVDEEKQRTKEMSQRGDFLKHKRGELLKERGSLKCCARCCTACCWEDTDCTKFWMLTFPVLVGCSLPCKCCRICSCCCDAEICCQKERILNTLDVDKAMNEWEKQLIRIKRQEMEEMLNNMLLG